MNIRGKVDFRRQSNATARDHRAIRLQKSEPKMRRVNGLGDFLSKFGKQLPDDIVGRKTICILGFEKFLANRSAFVDIEKAGVGHSFGRALRFRIEDVEAANNL